MVLRAGPLPAAALALLAGCASSPSPAEGDALELVRAYEESANRGAAGEAAGHFSEDAVWTIDGQTVCTNRAEVRELLAYQVAIETRRELTALERTRAGVRARLTGTNAFHAALGFDAMSQEVRFVLRDGRIRALSATSDPADRERLAGLLLPFLEWLGAAHPEEARVLMAADRLEDGTARGRRLLELVAEWRAEKK